MADDSVLLSNSLIDLRNLLYLTSRYCDINPNTFLSDTLQNEVYFLLVLDVYCFDDRVVSDLKLSWGGLMSGDLLVS